MNPELLHKYNIPAPRYTSYPTVPYWQKEKPSEEVWTKNVQVAFEKNNSIGLYIHLPYCENLCTYCGCNKRITKNHKIETPYIQTVLKEWDLYLQKMPQRPTIQSLHLGGGTPTFFSPKNLDYLLKGIFKKADKALRHDFSFEAHPSNTTKEHLVVLKSHGFNRISIGVQDFDEKILKTINRRQTEKQVESIVIEAWKLGYSSINFDLIFGLPFQNLDNIRVNMEKISWLRPDRIAFYSYAHVPWIYPGQRAYSEADLPTGKTKLGLYNLGKELLLEQGYKSIGLDHFARRTDSLFCAKLSGVLHRNFMGYTPYNTNLNIALGASAISDSWTGFVQNEKKIESYQNRVNEGVLPFFKGHLLSKEDQVLRKHILNLICRYKTDWSIEDSQSNGLEEASSRLQELAEDGLIRLNSSQILVTEKGKPFIRNICLALDTHYWGKQPKKQLFSQVV